MARFETLWKRWSGEDGDADDAVAVAMHPDCTATHLAGIVRSAKTARDLAVPVDEWAFRHSAADGAVARDAWREAGHADGAVTDAILDGGNPLGWEIPDPFALLSAEAVAAHLTAGGHPGEAAFRLAVRHQERHPALRSALARALAAGELDRSFLRAWLEGEDLPAPDPLPAASAGDHPAVDALVAAAPPVRGRDGKPLPDGALRGWLLETVEDEDGLPDVRDVARAASVHPDDRAALGAALLDAWLAVGGRFGPGTRGLHFASLAAMREALKDDPRALSGIETLLRALGEERFANNYLREQPLAPAPITPGPLALVALLAPREIGPVADWIRRHDDDRVHASAAGHLMALVLVWGAGAFHDEIAGLDARRDHAVLGDRWAAVLGPEDEE